MKTNSIIFFFSLFISISNHSSAQDFEWAKQYGSVNHDGNLAIAYSSDGYIYTCGYFRGNSDFDPDEDGELEISSVSASIDAFLVKSDLNGETVWAKSLGGSENDFATGIAIDEDGNILLIGNFEETADFDPGDGVFELTSAGKTDIFVVKLNSDGEFIWARGFGGSEEDDGHGVTVDVLGQVSFTGSFVGEADFADTTIISNEGADAFLSQLNSDGELNWAFGIGGSGKDFGNGIVANGWADIYVVGGFSDVPVDFDPGPGVANLGNGGMEDIFIAKYSSKGKLIWAKRAGAEDTDQANAVALGPYGNVYVTGYFWGYVDLDPGAGSDTYLASSTDVFAMKLSPDGDFHWAEQLGGNGWDQGNAIAVGPQEGVYITGIDPQSLGGVWPHNIGLYKLTHSGEVVWASKIGDGNEPQFGYGIATDEMENVYITGQFESTEDFDPYIAGTYELMARGGTSSDGYIVKLMADSDVGIDNRISNNTLSIYPNPANEKTYVTIPEDQPLKGLELLNSMGQVVMNYELANTRSNSTIEIDLVNLNPGVYFIKVYLENGTMIAKRLVVKA